MSHRLSLRPVSRRARASAGGLLSLSHRHRPTTSTSTSTFKSQPPITNLAVYATSSNSLSRPLKLAVIGSGPSGFYAASRVLALVPPGNGDVEVHMYERLPTPYGLARYGVAPDHPEVKNCQHKFDELVSDPRFRFFGNVSIGTTPPSSSSLSPPTTPFLALTPYTYPYALHLPLSSLLPYYTSILFTYGASLSNPLSSVPGSSSSSHPLPGVVPALAFVSWYNGHPAFAHLNPDLSGIESVDIVGQGNVALDVARILLSPPSALEDTDLPSPVLDVLRSSGVRKVRAVGRRGPAQVAFTTKEFREMVNLPDVAYPGISSDLMDPAKESVGNERVRKRLLTLMDKPVTSGSKLFELDFIKSPKAFLPNPEGKVGSVEWEVTELVPVPPAPSDAGVDQGPTGGTGPAPPPAAQVVARKTGETKTSQADMVVESVGYRSEPLGGGEWEGVFDTGKGRVRNVGGRVVNEHGEQVPGLYAAGWAARGPVGVIASTMSDAYGIASSILDDHHDTQTTPTSSSSSPLSIQTRPEPGIPEAIEQGLKENKVVDFGRWAKIDEAERKRAKIGGGKKEREKFRTVEEMLSVL